MPLNVFYTMVQKSKKWPKTQIKGGGSSNFWLREKLFYMRTQTNRSVSPSDPQTSLSCFTALEQWWFSKRKRQSWVTPKIMLLSIGSNHSFMSHSAAAGFVDPKMDLATSTINQMHKKWIQQQLWSLTYQSQNENWQTTCQNDCDSQV